MQAIPAGYIEIDSSGQVTNQSAVYNPVTAGGNTYTTGAYGVVETAVTGANSVNVIGVEGTFNTSDNLRREGVNGAIANLASVPNTVSVIYTNKPHWTSTLDGGTFWGN